MRRFLVAAFVAVAVFAPTGSAVNFPVRAIDGSGNNQRHSDWGQAGAQYLRVAPANYADGFNSMVSGTSPRSISNRIFNDIGQNIFSENDISQWGWAWGGRGTEFGPLQLAVWKRQFQDLRDGDRFFYLNDSALGDIQHQYGISYRRTLAQVIAANTRFNAQGNVFKAV